MPARLARAIGTDHGQTSGVEQSDLHEHTGLILVNVFVRNLAVLEADHDSDGHLNWLSRGRNAGQKPINLRCVREADEELIDNLIVAISESWDVGFWHERPIWNVCCLVDIGG